MTPTLKKYGLNSTPKDPRDFPLGGIVGHADLSAFPKEYTVGDPLVIKDQGPDTDMCTAYALTAVSEDQEGVVLDPFYTFSRTREITGADPEVWGADLRAACQSAVAPYGFVEGDEKEVSSPANMTLRNEALKNFPKYFDEQAKKHQKKTFYAVSGPYDFFNQVRSALWQTRDENRSILTGINWNPLWSENKDGHIVDLFGGETYGHAIKIFGFDTKSGIDFLVAQLSNGKEIGEGGIFHISRGVVNAACVYGGYTFLDLPVLEAQFELGRIGKLKYWAKSICL